MIRYINTFLRFLPLLVIPVLILPVITTIIGLSAKPQYIAAASLYMEQPLYLDAVVPSDGPDWKSPAQKQADFLIELTESRSFLKTVIERTSLKEGLEDEETAKKLYAWASGLEVDSSGWHIIKLGLSDTIPGASKEIITAAISVFFELVDARSKTQINSAFAYYQKRVTEAEKAFQNADLAYKKFLTEHPGIGGATNPDGSSRGLNQDDIEFARLGSVRDVAKTTYDEAQGQLTGIQQAYEGYLQSRETNFRVQDPPTEESYVAAKSKTVITMLGAGVAGGFLLMILGTLFLTWVDGSAREGASLRRALSQNNLFVQEVPFIKVKRLGTKKEGYQDFDLRRKLTESLQAEKPTSDKLLTGVN